MQKMLLACIAVSGVLLNAHVALAQDEIRELSDTQFEMNEKAVEAVENKEYEKAIKLYQASIELGEVNITYLNMARTYHRMGECAKAKRTYRKTRDVRFKISNPTPAEINEALNTFESELYKDCAFGELVVMCEPGKMDLYLNGSGPIDCPSNADPLRLKEGTYTIRGELEGYEPNEISINVIRVDPTTVALTLAKKMDAPLTDRPPTEIVIKGDGSRETLEEINTRLELEAREKAEREERARQAEIDRQRQLDDERVRMESLRDLAVEVERKNTVRRRAMLGIGTTSLIVGGALWDSCMFNYFGDRPDDVWCASTYDGRFQFTDLGPVGLYAAGVIGIPLLIRALNKKRIKDFELQHKVKFEEVIRF